MHQVHGRAVQDHEVHRSAETLVESLGEVPVQTLERGWRVTLEQHRDIHVAGFAGGKDYPMPDGGTTAWTASSPTVWDGTNKLTGKVATTFHLELNGDTLTVAGKVTKPDGGTMDFASTLKRVSGGPGFMGKWVSTAVKMPTMTLGISTNGPNGIASKDDTGPLFSGQFDGKDNPALGVMAGSKTTFALKKLGPSSFEVTPKVDGKPMVVEVYAVSADGRTLTVDGTPASAKTEKYTLVLDKQ